MQASTRNHHDDAAGSRQEALNAENRPASEAAAPPRILVVEDDEVFKDILRQFLERQGYVVDAVSGGHEALDYLRRDRPDLIVLDAKMPEMDGFTACRMMREMGLLDEIPLIMVTCYQDQESLDRAYEAGAVDYVTKPVHWAIFRRRLATLIELYQSRQRLLRAMEARHEAERRLQQAQRMEAVGLMASGVAHDLNNILSGLVGYPELLLDRLDPDDPLRELVLPILDAGKRAAEIVGDLLTIARGGASKKEVADLNRIAAEVKESPEWRHIESVHPDIEVRWRLAPGRLAIHCSPAHVKKSLFNLLINAADAISGPGRISVTTALARPDERPDLPRLEGDPKTVAVLSVSDTGCGIPEEDRQRIFEPFYTTKYLGRSGSGLGLTAVWNTMADHGGQIRVDSGPQGTCFDLLFPAMATAQTDEQAETAVDPGPAKGRGETILVVDDERLLRDLAANMLRRLGYEVLVAASGEEAVEVLRRREVDLLILDMVMGAGMGGRETLESALEIRPGQKAILVSGYAENEEVERALALGAACFLKKPYSLHDLARVTRQVLDGAFTRVSPGR